MPVSASSPVPLDFWPLLCECLDPVRRVTHQCGIEERLLCGRWLALRRLRLGLGCCWLAECLGVQAGELQLTEAGVAPTTLLTPKQRYCLAKQLTPDDPGNERTWVARVVAVALGNPIGQRGELLVKVRADIEAMIPSQN